MQTVLPTFSNSKKRLAILIDPDKFNVELTAPFLRKLPTNTSHIFVGGSTVASGLTERLVKELKLYTSKPIVIFPGDVNQITAEADALLFLSLLSGNNPEYLIEQQIKAVEKLTTTQLEVIPVGYILIDGGNTSAVSRITQTQPISQENWERIVATAKAAEYLGKKLIYLEAGSGAKFPVSPKIIEKVTSAVSIPVIVGGGIRTEAQKQHCYKAGASMVVMGTAYES